MITMDSICDQIHLFPAILGASMMENDLELIWHCMGCTCLLCTK